LRRRLGGPAPDLVLAHGVRAVKLAKAAFLGRAPVVGVAHNFRGRTELEGLDLAICVSAAIARDVKARYPGLQTRVVENFADLPAPTPHPPHEGPPRIVALGRLHRNKGFGVLLAAAALARDRGLEFELTIAGDGPERTALVIEAEVLRLNDRVRFTGWVEDAAGLLARADLFVLPSIVEPFGLVLIEAMAAGAPVVASEIDGPRDILDGGRLGALVPPDDPEALAEAIIAALADPEGAAAVARLAQAEVLARYSLAAGGARLTAALAPLIRPRSQ